MDRKRKPFLLGVAAALLGGCTMAPEYERPAAPVPAEWPAGPAYQEQAAADSAPTAAELPWREFFTDPRLQQVIGTALENNRDLRLAAQNVERARAFYGIRRAEVLPSVDAKGGWSKQRIPGSVMGFPEALTIERYDVNLGITAWEIDLFGRIQSLKDQALQDYLATDQARRGAQILLVSSTAQVYLLLAADREILSTATSTLEAQEATYEMIRSLFDSGLASELELRQAQGQAEAARVEVARWIQVVAQDENALSLLAGSPLPAALLPETLDGVAPPAEVSAGLSSEILLGRPDILAAEHRLKAANATIGAARAAFFPRISLTAAFGTASTDLSGLFKSGSEAWSFAPQVVLPIFDARTWSAYRVTKAEREIAVTHYEQAIQTAFREVADALAVRGTVDRQIAAQQSLVEAAEQTHRLALLRYTEGIDSYLGVLDAQRALYGARQGLIALRLAGHANQIALYQVLGGGA